jgi:predicted GIY-YIG superfamily endonuclease
MECIYQFLNKDEEVIYVGITSNIKGRIRSQHFTEGGHLPKDCYEEAQMVVYSECLSHDDARIKERYLINTLHPKFNTMMNNASKFNFVIDDFQWKYIAIDKSKIDQGPKRGIPKEINQYLKFCKTKRRHPHGTSQDQEEKRLADWAIEFAIEVGSFEHPKADAIKSIPDFFAWRRGSSEEWAYAYSKFVELTGFMPTKSKNVEYSSELSNSLAIWAYRNKKAHKQAGLINRTQRWHLNFKDYKKFKIDFGRHPRRAAGDDQERFLSRWGESQRYRTQTIHTIEQANLLLNEGVITKDDISYKLAIECAHGDELVVQATPSPLITNRIATLNALTQPFRGGLNMVAGQTEDVSRVRERMAG